MPVITAVNGNLIVALLFGIALWQNNRLLALTSLSIALVSYVANVLDQLEGRDFLSRSSKWFCILLTLAGCWQVLVILFP